MEWSLDIEKVENGFVITTFEEQEDSNFKLPRKVLFQFGEDSDFGDSERKNELDTMKSVLEFVVEYFGMGYNKWDKNNIDIKTDYPGHKVEEENGDE